MPNGNFSTGDMATTQDLAEHLLASMPEHEAWSLVESPNSSGCYDELLNWAEGMTYNTWRTELAMRRPQLGLVLLWLESEVARRKCGEGIVWPILSDRGVVPWQPGVYSELFSSAGNATANHRDLLRHTAIHYSLRNTFIENDAQNWYRLIYLQFGFTHDDAVKRLANWLSGQETFSVQHLLASNDTGAHAFQELWRSLRMFRLGNLSRATLETRLKSNSWVLPEWSRDLIEAAKSSRAQLLEVADLEAAEVRFFTVPKLGLSAGGEPFFTTSLCNLNELNLESADYQLMAGDQVLARLIRQANGSYFSDVWEAITLPLQPIVALSLVESDGRIVAHDEAVLWDPIEEVSIYSHRNGSLIPPADRLRAGTGVFAIVGGDVSLRPAPAESHELPFGYRLHRIAQGWTGQIEAILDDDVVWASSTAAQADLPHTASVSANFTQTLDLRDPPWNKIKPPWSLPLRFSFPAGWEFSRLRWRRGDGQRVELDQMPANLTLTEMDAVRPVVLRVQITDGTRHRTDVVRIPVPFAAVLKWTEGGIPRRHLPEKNLLLGEARKVTWSFCLPNSDGRVRDTREFSFAEGNRLVGRLKARPSRLPDLAGYGAALRVFDDPYQSDKAIMTVAECVLDGGVLGAVRRNLEDGGFRIRSSFSNLGPDHRIQVWLSTNGDQSAVEEIPHAQLVQMDDGWLWKGGEGYRLHAIALTFRGIRLGAWFDHASWSEALVKSPPTSLEATAAMLRAWKAPILKEEGDHFKLVSSWFSQNLIRILPVWLTQDSQRGPAGDNMVMPPRNDSWCSAVNDLLVEALPAPDAESAGELVKKLAPNSTGVHALGSAMWILAEVCPIFTARVVKVYLQEFVPAAQRHVFLGQLLPLPDFADSDERAAELGRIHGNRDGFWLSHTVPTLAAIRQHGQSIIRRDYRLLSRSKDYRYYALGRWLREIR